LIQKIASIILLCSVIFLLDSYAFSADRQTIVQDKKFYIADGVEGYSYSGGMRSGLPEGKGVVVFPNGDSYSGRFVSGQFDGTGIFTSSNWRFEGGFSKGSLHDTGVFTANDGSMYRGAWHIGVLIR
jgi:hypothetical protein